MKYIKSLEHSNENKIYPIQVVARKTGISPHVVRKWESRYNFPSPGRTESNRRLYSDTDVSLLQKALNLKEQGYRINEIVKILGNRNPAGYQNSGENNFIGDFFDAVTRLDKDRVTAVLETAYSIQGLSAFILTTILPILEQTGKRWQKGNIQVFNEHFLSSIIRYFLTKLLEEKPDTESEPPLVFCTLSGQQHEFGILIAAVIMHNRGYKILYLGTEVPLEEIPAAASDNNAAAVLISEIAGINEEKKEMIEYLAKNLSCTLIIGTNNSDLSYLQKANVVVYNDLKYLFDTNLQLSGI